MKKLLGWIVTILLAPIFLFILYMMFLAAPIDLIVSGWRVMRGTESVEGTVLESRIVEDRSPLIRYRFQIDGDEYVSERYRPGTVTLMSTGAERGLVAQFPEGGRFPVFFPAGKPESAFLIKGFYQHSLAWFLLVLGMCLVNLVNEVLGWKGETSVRVWLLTGFSWGICLTGLALLFSDQPTIWKHNYSDSLYLFAIITAVALVFCGARMRWLNRETPRRQPKR